MVSKMRMKMSRADRKVANFLLSAIRDYGIRDFDVHDSNVKESAYHHNIYLVVSYSVTIGANVVSIEYYCNDYNTCRAYVYVNDYSVAHCKVACHSDMSRVVGTFAALVQHLN